MTAMKRRFEFKDEKSDKFWQYETVGSNWDCKITWGRTGSTGQSQIVELAVAEKRAQEKLSKGYVEVDRLRSQPRVKKPIDILIKSEESDDMWDELIKNIKSQ